MSTTIMSISAAVGGAAVGGFTGWVPLPDDAGCRFNYAEGGRTALVSLRAQNNGP